MSPWAHAPNPYSDVLIPAIQAYTAVTAVVPILGTLIVTVVCAALFVLMLALGISARADLIYSIAVFGVVLAAGLASGKLTTLLQRRRRPPRIVSLAWIASSRASAFHVGHKAANLARTGAEGGRIALGFVVTADAFDQFLVANGLDSVESENPEFADRIRAGTVPRRLLARLHRFLLATASSGFLLRSSFFDEDTGDRAFPGVYESLPWDIEDGRQALGEALKAVWASYWSERAIEYRAIGGLHGAPKRRLAVLVNVRMPHDLTGFASSADVRSGFTERHLVEVSTDGQEVTAEHSLLSDVIQVLEASPDHEPDRPLLREVSLLAGRAEVLAGRPVEVEWGRTDGRVWVYQVRPLTSLPRRSTFTNSYVVDVPRYPITPLSWWFLFGDGSPAQVLGSALERLGLGGLDDGDVKVFRGVLYVRWERFKLLFVEAPWTDVRLSIVVRVLAEVLRAWSVGADEVVSPNVPAPPPEGLAAAELLGRIEGLRSEKLVPLVLRQGIAVQSAAFVDALLRQILGAGRVPAPRVVPPVERLRAEMAEAGPGGSLAAQHLIQKVWFLSEREAELSSLRAIDFPEAFLLRLGLTASGNAGRASRPVPGRPLERSWWLRQLVRIRDRLLIEREQLNARINAVDFEARLAAEALSAVLGQRFPEWQPEDVFFFTVPELRRIAQGAGGDFAGALHLARHRRALHTRNSTFDHPAVLHFDNHGQLLAEPEARLREGVISIGIPLGGGTARGPIRVLRTGDWVRPDSVIGCVVVLPDPSAVWTAIAGSAAGVLFARGGPLSHLAIWCRERGIPTVVAARRIYEVVKDGDRVVVDGDRGELRGD